MKRTQFRLGALLCFVVNIGIILGSHIQRERDSYRRYETQERYYLAKRAQAERDGNTFMVQMYQKSADFFAKMKTNQRW